jgi:hypothetical protein
MSAHKLVDVVISFDTTGSMYPCLTQVRRKVEELVKRLFEEVPGIRMGVVAHGDYCDAGSTYVTKIQDLSDDMKRICHFVQNVGSSGGGDAPECYELVLHEARSLAWRAGATRALVMIGDERPHEPDYPMNTKKLDWRNELKMLQEMEVKVYGVHAMAAYRSDAKHFWEQMAKMTGGYYLTLDQFNEIRDLLMAICYHQTGDIKLLAALRDEMSGDRRMTRSMADTFQALTGDRPEVNAVAPPAEVYSGGYSRAVYRTAVTEADLEAYGDVKLEPVPPGRFQRLEVDKGASILQFVNENIGEGSFKKGSGYYQFGKKPVEVQSYKKVVLVDKDSGEMFSGDAARKLIKLPKGRAYKLKPSEVDLNKYWVFIQSTSVNRKLLGGDNFLYEVAEFAEDVADGDDD